MTSTEAVARSQRTFYHLLANTLLVSVTNFTVWFAVTFYVYLQTRSVFATGLISGIYLAFTALSGMWFGSLVDHHKKKSAMQVSSAASLAVYAVSLAVYLAAGPEAFTDPASATLWIFVLLQMMGVIVGNVRMIAMSTVVTLLIPAERRDKANGLVGTASGISFLITSVISGILVGLAGMLYVLILAITVTAASMIHLWAVPVREDRVAHGEQAPRRIDIRGTFAVISGVSGLFALLIFTTINNFLFGVYMALMDAYGLSLVSVEVWGLLWGVLSGGFILGGFVIAKWGLGRNPLRAMLLANVVIWAVSSVFAIRSSIVLLAIGMMIFMCVMPYIEASEQTVLQKVVPFERQGRVFGFAQSMEQSASPLTAFLISPIAQFVFIPFMTTGAGVDLIGGWFGTGPERGLALVFTVTGIIGLILTLAAFRTRGYRMLSERYLENQLDLTPGTQRPAAA